MILTARENLSILEEIEDGRPARREQAIALLSSPGDALHTLLACARRLRRPTGLVTYSRKVFVPLTNLCRDVCGYCTFARPDNDPKAHTMTPEEVLAVARAGKAAGCKEALFSLGERPEERYPKVLETLRRLGYASTTAYLAAMCELVFRETGLLPHVNCGILDPRELESLAPYSASMGLMLENTSIRLLEKGQAHWACPGKVPSLRLQTIRDGAALDIAFTTGILIGIGETLAERVDTLFAIRDLAAETGNVQEVIIQNFRAKPDTRFRNGPPRADAGTPSEPTALDMARTIAVARIILGSAANVQAPPNLSPDTYAFYLLAGLNDWGGISPVTRDHINPEADWPQIPALARTSAQAGFELRERLALYPEFQTPRFVRPALAPRILALVDGDGLVAREPSPF